jgi:hypothetical protein
MSLENPSLVEFESPPLNTAYDPNDFKGGPDLKDPAIRQRVAEQRIENFRQADLEATATDALANIRNWEGLIKDQKSFYYGRDDILARVRTETEQFFAKHGLAMPREETAAEVAQREWTENWQWLSNPSYSQPLFDRIAELDKSIVIDPPAPLAAHEQADVDKIIAHGIAIGNWDAAQKLARTRAMNDGASALRNEMGAAAYDEAVANAKMYFTFRNKPYSDWVGADRQLLQQLSKLGSYTVKARESMPKTDAPLTQAIVVTRDRIAARRR